MENDTGRFDRYVTGLLALLFVGTTIRWTTTTVTILLFIGSLFVYYLMKKKNKTIIFPSMDKKQSFFLWCLIFLLLSYLISFVFGRGWQLPSATRPEYISLVDLEIPLRYFIGIFIFTLFLKLSINIKIQNIILFVGIGGIANGCIAIYERYVLGMSRVDGWVGIAEMGTASSLLCLFSLIFLFFTKTTKEKVFLFVATTMSFTSAFSSATRSVMFGLCASLVIVMIVVLIRERKKWKIGSLVLTSFLCIFLLLWAFPVGGKDTFRIGAIQSDLSEYQKDNPHTSIGMRFEAWKEAWTMFKMSPIYGMNSAMIMKNAQEIIEVSGTRLRQNNIRSLIGTAHNQYLEALGKRGIIGLTALLFFIAASFTLFISYLKNKNDFIFKISLMGFVVVFYDVCVSFTGEPWDSMVDTPMFILLISLFTRLIEQEKDEKRYFGYHSC